MNLHDRMCTPFSLCDKRKVGHWWGWAAFQTRHRGLTGLCGSPYSLTPLLSGTLLSPVPFSGGKEAGQTSYQLGAGKDKRKKNALQQQENISSEQVPVFASQWRCTLYSHPGIAPHFLASAPPIPCTYCHISPCSFNSFLCTHFRHPTSIITIFPPLFIREQFSPFYSPGRQWLSGSCKKKIILTA